MQAYGFCSTGPHPHLHRDWNFHLVSNPAKQRSTFTHLSSGGGETTWTNEVEEEEERVTVMQQRKDNERLRESERELAESPVFHVGDSEDSEVDEG